MCCSDVFKELASKKCVKLEKLLKERGMELLRKGLLPPTTSNDTSLKVLQYYLIYCHSCVNT